jgi:antitoxin HigA-1
MTEFTVSRPIRRAPTHPGELMREIIEEHRRIGKTEAADRMQISRQSLYAVLKGESAVTADMALYFARLTGGAAELFVNMQSAHDLWHAAQRLKKTLSQIEPVA